MDHQHPITPPPELVQQWAVEYWGNPGETVGQSEKYIATQAARWGANMEVDACCKEILAHPGFEQPDLFVELLLDKRRPKPPSLKKQALEALEAEDDSMPLRSLERSERFELIRRALEQLDERPHVYGAA